MTTYEVESDSKTVWVHSSDGHTVARFGSNGIDVHNADSTACLACTHEPTTVDDWPTFVGLVAEHYGVTVDDSHRPVALTRTAITAAVRGYRYSYSDEHELQAGLADALTAAGLVFEREVALGPRDRIDFVVDRVGIEVKIDGAPAVVLRQLLRYAHSDRVDHLILVTTRRTHRTLPLTVGAVPLTIVEVGGGW